MLVEIGFEGDWMSDSPGAEEVPVSVDGLGAGGGSFALSGYDRAAFEPLFQGATTDIRTPSSAS